MRFFFIFLCLVSHMFFVQAWPLSRRESRGTYFDEWLCNYFPAEFGTAHLRYSFARKMPNDWTVFSKQTTFGYATPSKNEPGNENLFSPIFLSNSSQNTVPRDTQYQNTVPRDTQYQNTVPRDTQCQNTVTQSTCLIQRVRFVYRLTALFSFPPPPFKKTFLLNIFSLDSTALLNWKDFFWLIEGAQKLEIPTFRLKMSSFSLSVSQ